MTSKSSSQKISIVDVGPRDGLQNEDVILSVEARLEFIRRLVRGGLKKLEVGAFVSPKWVPQMVGSEEVITKILQEQRAGQIAADVEFSALVPNLRGMEQALAAGLKHVAVFGSASETFSQENINCSIDESLNRFEKIVAMAQPQKIKVRGYISMCFGCPFEGEISEDRVVELVKRYHEMGIYEVSIGDTIGVADPAQVRRLVSRLIQAIGVGNLAMHFHDTRGTALANVLASLELGIRVFDSSLGGLGGCPHAPSATGNLATEDAVYMLERMGYSTGLNLASLLETNHWVTSQVGHELPSRLGKAGIPVAKNV
jgi:hydroxymethylglutaryl-CoA lyase